MEAGCQWLYFPIPFSKCILVIYSGISVSIKFLLLCIRRKILIYSHGNCANTQKLVGFGGKEGFQIKHFYYILMWV